MANDRWTKSKRSEPNAYSDWISGPGKAYVVTDDDEFISLNMLVDLKALGKGSHVKRLTVLHEKILNPLQFRTTALEQQLERANYGLVYLSGVIPLQNLGALLKSKFRKAIPKIDTGKPLPGSVVCDSFQPKTPTVKNLPEQPETVVIGIIDDSLAFANERFSIFSDQKNTFETRVESAWIQDGICKTKNSPVPFGREYRKDEINNALKSSSQDDLLDEDLFYATTGIVDMGSGHHQGIAQRIGHGTHMMDLACGFDPRKETEEARNRPIVCVQLRDRTTKDTSGAGLEADVLQGIEHILDRADRIAQDLGCGRLPVVINLSYGFAAGPHDGTHPLEDQIDRMIEYRTTRQKAPLEVILASGNAHLNRGHAKCEFTGKNQCVEMTWRVLPDDRTSSFMEIWLPYTAEAPGNLDSRLSVTVTPAGPPEGNPNAKQSPELLEIENCSMSWSPQGTRDVVCRISYEYVGRPTFRARYLISLLPTAYLDAPTTLAPSGDWRVTLTSQTDEVFEVEAWIQRDDTPLGYPRFGRQSYFNDINYVRFDKTGHLLEQDDHADQTNPTYVKRDGAINAIATGSKTVVVGGYYLKEQLIARYSGGGPITPTGNRPKASRQGPDAAAVSDDSKVHTGVIASGTRSNSAVALNGTSVTAAQITRLIAADFANNQPWAGGREVLKKRALADEAGRNPFSIQLKPTQTRGGWGRVKTEQPMPTTRRRYFAD